MAYNHLNFVPCAVEDDKWMEHAKNHTSSLPSSFD